MLHCRGGCSSAGVSSCSSSSMVVMSANAVAAIRDWLPCCTQSCVAKSCHVKIQTVLTWSAYLFQNSWKVVSDGCEAYMCKAGLCCACMHNTAMKYAPDVMLGPNAGLTPGCMAWGGLAKAGRGPEYARGWGGWNWPGCTCP